MASATPDCHGSWRPVPGASPGDRVTCEQSRSGTGRLLVLLDEMEEVAWLDLGNRARLPVREAARCAGCAELVPGRSSEYVEPVAHGVPLG